MKFNLHFTCPDTVSDHDIAYILRDVARAVELGKVGKALDIRDFFQKEVIGQYELTREARTEKRRE